MNVGTQMLKVWERWFFAMMVLLLPLIVLGLHLPLTGPVSEAWMDLVLRLIFLLMVAWIRLMLFSDFSSPNFAIWVRTLLPMMFLLTIIPMFKKINLVLLFHIIDCIVFGFLTSLLFESFFSVFRQVVGGKQTLSSLRLAGRFQRLREVLDWQKRVALAFTVLVLFALYVLARNYIFDCVIYSWIGAAVLILAFIIPLIVSKTRIDQSSTFDVKYAEWELEKAFDRQLHYIDNGLESLNGNEVTFYLNYRHALRESMKLPITWETWAYLCLLVGAILLEPFIFGTMVIH